jgi:radical SAM protein with 4Fe4S-binding SPASM domain
MESTDKSELHLRSIDPTQTPRISDSWRLRNDGHNIIVYKCSVLGHKFKVLSPFEAAFIPLVDGTLTFDELKDRCIEIFNPPEDFREEFVSTLYQIFEGLLSIEGFITLEGNISPSLNNPADFIPDHTHYHFPALRLERPLSVMIAFTNRCFCNCRYCYAQKRRCKEADITQWKEVFNELAENEIYLVDIAGGDIFSRDDSLDILNEMVSRDFTFFVSTKSYLSCSDAEQLAEMGIGKDIAPYVTRNVQVSVDSADDSTASYLVRKPGYLEIATQTTENLIAAGIYPRIKGVLTSYNADAPAGIVHHFSKLGVTDFDFVLYSRSYYRHDDSLFLSWQQKMELHEMAKTLTSEFPSIHMTFQDETTSGKPLNMTCEQWEERAVCSGGRSNMLIQPNGDVTLCDQTPHEAPFIVGNVFSQGVLEVWRSRNLLDFLYPDREKFAGSVCYDCPEFDTCQQYRGYCYRDALFYYGSIYDAPPECPWQRKNAPRKT